MIPFSGSRILVPLDGSAAAEHALAPAAQIARATGSSVVLARIVPVRMWSANWPGTSISEETYQQLLEEEDLTTRDYLARMVEDLTDQGVTAQAYTDRGAAAETLLGLQQRFHVGLVVMTTHGRTGMARLTLGSVADRIVRGGRAPVLLVRPFAPASGRNNTLESALVPLDGSRVSEIVLEVVRQLAGALLHRVTLLRAVNATEPASARISAERYIEAQRDELFKHLEPQQCDVTAIVVTGDAAHSILMQAGHDHDLIMMATHGETGIRRFAAGSVADVVLHDTLVPLLLVHPTAESPETVASDAAKTRPLGVK